MSEQPGLSFVPSDTMLIVGVVLLAATAALCVLAWRRSGFRGATGWLELLRFVLVALVIITLCQPEWLSSRSSEQLPTLAILWDQSDSMHTRDVVSASLPANAGAVSRAEAITPLLNISVWSPTGTGEGSAPQDALNIVFEPFSSLQDLAEQGTDLNQVLENHSNLKGVVMLTDGDWNVGRSPIEAATRFRMQGIPVFAVAVGSRTPLPDLELLSMDAPTFGVAQKSLRVPFAVKSSLGQDRDVSLTLRANGEPAASRVVRVPAMGEIQQNLTWTPPATGDYILSLQLAQDPQDRIADNNVIEAPIAIRQEQLKVLVIESYPRWEYRYLRNALERDPGVNVTCLLFHPQMRKVGGGRGYIKRFPSAGELSRFDVVFLGDVGVGPKQLAAAHLSDLKQLVSAQAAGLVFIPGRYGNQASLTTGPLADLYPVIVDTARPTGIGDSTPGHFALTQSGQRSLLTRLADTDQDNADLWNRLPGFHWFAGVKRAAAGSEILAVHDRQSTAAGRVPLIVTKTYGTGKVLFMGTDSAWRWREGVEDRYHYRFWGQVARWMAYQRQKVQGKSMRVFATPDRPHVDDRVTLNANVLNANGGFLEQGMVTVQTISPSGRTQSIRLEAGEGDSRGLFTGSFVPEEPGNYSLIAASAETGATVQTNLSIQGLNRERQGRLARFDVLEEVTSVAKGKLVSIAEVRRLLDYLAKLPAPEPILHRTRIWSHPAWAGLLILLMGVFWTGRKMIGAV